MKLINYFIYLLIFAIICILIYSFVLKKDDEQIENLIINTSSITLEIDESKKIDAYIENNSGAIPNFHSVDESIATVSSDGTVTGIKNGITTIIISYTSKRGNLTSKCDVIVNDTKGKSIINNIRFPKDDLLLELGSTYSLDYILEPNNTPSNIQFTSSNENVASVDKDGTIAGFQEGNAIIRITINDNLYKDLNVYVRENVKTEYITIPTDIKVQTNNIKLKVGEEETILFDVTPSEASLDVIKVISNNESVARFENGKIKALSEGKAILTIESVNNLTLHVNIEVTRDNIKVEDIRVTSNNILSINVNETSQITYSIMPNDATNKEVTFESLSPNIATVSSAGLITGISKGDAYITITTRDGNYQVYVKVTVNSISDNNDNDNGKSGVNTTCNTGDANDAEFEKCFAVSRQLVVDKTTISIPAGGTGYVQVTLPSSCGTLVRYTRKSADGETGWSNYVTQSRTNETNTGFTWVINAKSSAKGKEVLVSQTIQYDSLSPSGKCTGNVKSMKTITVKIT